MPPYLFAGKISTFLGSLEISLQLSDLLLALLPQGSKLRLQRRQLRL